MAERLYKYGRALNIYDCHPHMTPYLYTHKVKSTVEQWRDLLTALRNTKWIYVGSLQYHVSEAQVHSLFSKCGIIERIVFGVNRNNHNQKIGFCFIEYLTNESAIRAVKGLHEYVFCDKRLSVQLDPGFEEGRQFGRGETGHQRNREKERSINHYRRKLNSNKYKNKQKRNKRNKSKKHIKTEENDMKEDEDATMNDYVITDIKQIADDVNVKEEHREPQVIKEEVIKEKVIEEEVMQDVEIIKEENAMHGSQFDVLPVKKRKLNKGIAYKLKAAERKIDRRNYLQRQEKQLKKKQTEDELDAITIMLESTLTGNTSNAANIKHENDGDENGDESENGEIEMQCKDEEIQCKDEEMQYKDHNNDKRVNRNRGKEYKRGKRKQYNRNRGKRKQYVRRNNNDFEFLMEYYNREIINVIDSNKMKMDS